MFPQLSHGRSLKDRSHNFLQDAEKERVHRKNNELKTQKFRAQEKRKMEAQAAAKSSKSRRSDAHGRHPSGKAEAPRPALPAQPSDRWTRLAR